MNLRFDLRYLSGGDAIFGPNFGGATVYTVTRAGYSRLCPNVGRLLDFLDREGLAENTIVVYTSDQGFFLGEHRFYDKRLMYEPGCGRIRARELPGSRA